MIISEKLLILIEEQQREGIMRKMIDIDFGSSRYDELVELRYKILLEPLGLKFLEIGRAHV